MFEVTFRLVGDTGYAQQAFVCAAYYEQAIALIRAQFPNREFEFIRALCINQGFIHFIK